MTIYEESAPSRDEGPGLPGRLTPEVRYRVALGPLCIITHREVEP